MGQIHSAQVAPKHSNMNPSNRVVYNSGDKIGNCVYMNEEPTRKWIRYARFECVCGNKFITRISSIVIGSTSSCGCIQKSVASKTFKKGGHSQKSEYKIWHNMRDRCSNPNSVKYENYGGKGIRVCDRWVNSFENFLNDMGPRPSMDHSVDRFPDKNGDYSPDNCRWGTKIEQANNKNNNLIIKYMGQDKTLAEWIRLLNLDYNLVNKRISQGKWTADRAFTTPKPKKCQK